MMMTTAAAATACSTDITSDAAIASDAATVSAVTATTSRLDRRLLKTETRWPSFNQLKTTRIVVKSLETAQNWPR